MTGRLRAEKTLAGALKTAVADATALLGAEFGDFQLTDGDWLKLVEQRGFDRHFLVSLRRLSRRAGTPCARALTSGEQVIIEDVGEDAAFAPYLDIAEANGFRACQSTPLRLNGGPTIGVMSTHFARAHRPSRIEMETVHSYAQTVAEHIHALADGTPVNAQADLLFDAMLERTRRRE